MNDMDDCMFSLEISVIRTNQNQRKRTDNYANFNGNHNEQCSAEYIPVQWNADDGKLLKKLEKHSLQHARYKNTAAYQQQLAQLKQQQQLMKEQNVDPSMTPPDQDPDSVDQTIIQAADLDQQSNGAGSNSNNNT